ncbi:hypothetical protein [Actinospica robiniae]|uniref:hypothetical protein n=1 Tax=Actinospica robiniae TaxID=304901 RepID=UPI0004204A15|nr:hypothetical protein [Actinospica robiniae]
MPQGPGAYPDDSAVPWFYRGIFNSIIEANLATARAKGLADLLLEKLEMRRISLDSAQFERIRNCTNETSLEIWYIRAVHATKAEHVFRD